MDKINIFIDDVFIDDDDVFIHSQSIKFVHDLALY